MKQNIKILVLGGDKRNDYLANMLEQAGYQVKKQELFNEQSVKNMIHEFDLVVGGNINSDIVEEANRNHILVFDFMKVDQIAIKNAVATGEGAIAQAILQSEVTIHHSNCLVLGYGRCGKVLASQLLSLGANVTVSVRRKEQFGEIEFMGFTPDSIFNLTEKVSKYHYIFNTIPALVLTDDCIDQLSQKCVIVDIASSPGGTDFKQCEERGIKAILSLGIPGKYAPYTTAEILFDYVEHLLHSVNRWGEKE